MTNETIDNPSLKEKKRSPILGILKIVAIVLAVVVFLTTVMTNVMLVYVIFAPDNMPKPFYMMYYNAGETPQAPSAQQQSGKPAESKQTTPGPTLPAGGENGGAPEAPVGVSSIMPGQGILLDTGTKIVNLAETGGTNKFIRTNIVLEFAPTDPLYFATDAPKTAETTTISPKQEYITKYKDELNTRLPVINDSIINLLSTKTFQAIYTSEGKENLRQEIMQAVNARLQGFKVIYVYFTEFVMQ